MLKLLHDWQDLLGATIGAVSGLLAALLMAYKLNYQEQQQAAMLIMIDLVAMIQSIDHAEELANAKTLDNEKNAAFSDRLLILLPKFSPLFESSMIRLLTCDKYLAANLTLLSALYRDALTIMLRLQKDADLINKDEDLHRPMAQMESDIALARQCFLRINTQSKSAKYFLEKTVMSSYPTFYKLRRRLLPTAYETRLYNVLMKGGVLE